MSTRHILDDQQQLVPGYTSLYWGKYFSLDSSGGNQVKGQPLAPHAYTLRLTDQFTPLRVTVTCSTGAKRYYADIVSYRLDHSWSSADDYALYGKLERAYDKGGFNAGVFAGELGETADLLAGRAKQLAKAVVAARKGRFAQAAHILGVGGDRKVSPSTRRRHRDDAGNQHPQKVSDGWLELQYGWKPLLSDIWSLADQIAKSDKPRTRRIAVSHAIKAKGFMSIYPQVSGGGSLSKQIIAYVTEDIPSWPQALGLMDPEVVAWELVPFSFVADWFIPVGNWLEARAFASRAKGTFVTTTRSKVNVRINEGEFAYNRKTCYNNELIYTGSLGWLREVKIDRTVSSSLPQVPLPVFKNGLGAGNRLANAVALVAGIFSGARK